jgi:methyl-accepting chemotaxis protein
MPLFKKLKTLKTFKGTIHIPWPGFRVKVYAAAIIFLMGILLQGVIILLAGTGSQRVLAQQNTVRERVLAEINYMAGLSPAILRRCLAGSVEGAVVETADIRQSMAFRMDRLHELLKKEHHVMVLDKNYQLLSKELENYNHDTITTAQYVKIKKFYNQYMDSLTDLKQAVGRYRVNESFYLLNHRQLLLIAVCLLAFTLILTGVLLISAVQSIVMPAKLMTNVLNEAKQRVFKVEIPVTFKDGLGKAMLIFKESLTYWNTKLLDSKNSICQLDKLCKELVTEIRKTELFAIQLQAVAEELTEKFSVQNQLIAENHEQLVTLLNNSEKLQKVPQRLTIIHDDLQTQLNTVKEQIQEILNQTHIYKKDESNEIADLAENLNVASEKVNGVIMILNDVAERTELLAFNTAIQAARAGDKGLGFGVVAKEIAKLVDYSKKASLQLSTMLNKINTKNECIIQLIKEYSQPNDHASIYEEVAKICSDSFETAQTNAINIEKLTKVMEIVFTKSNQLASTSQNISNLADEENIGPIDFDLETLDYQLNVKEANRIAIKVNEVSEELRALAESATGEDQFLD